MFKIGDIVTVKTGSYFENHYGMMGVIITTKKYTGCPPIIYYGVFLDSAAKRGTMHNLDGHLPFNKGWYFKKNEITESRLSLDEFPIEYSHLVKTILNVKNKPPLVAIKQWVKGKGI